MISTSGRNRKRTKKGKNRTTDTNEKLDGLAISGLAARLWNEMLFQKMEATIEHQKNTKNQLITLIKAKSGKNTLESTMSNIRRRLRRRFYAETDIEIKAASDNWKKYALWLEILATKEINTGLAKENQMLLATIERASKILDRGITGIQAKTISI